MAVYGVLTAVSLQGIAEAQSTVTPRLSARGIYTDNVFLSDEDEQDDFVVEIKPGVHWSQRSRRFVMDMDLEAQILGYTNNENEDGDSVVVNPNFTLSTTSTLINQYLFLDVDGEYGQRLSSLNQRASFDNIALTGDRSDFYSYRISPYIQHRTGGGIDYLLRAEQSTVNFDLDDEDEAESLNDADTERYVVNISNRASGSRFTWALSGTESSIERANESAAQSEFRSASVNLGYRLSTRWSLIAQGGYSENFIDGVERGVNGEYYAGGFSWYPTPRLTLSALHGDRYSEGSLRWQPSRRTEVELVARESDVGINTGESQSVNIRWRGRRSQLYARYDESITNEQFLILEGETLIPIVDPDGNPIIDPNTGNPLVIPIGNFALADDDFLRERGEIGFTYDGRRMRTAINVYQETREYLNRVTLNGDSIGGNITATIPVVAGWSFVGRVNIRDTTYDSDGAKEITTMYRAGMEQALSLKTKWGFYWQYSEQDSDREELALNFKENRLVAEWIYKY
ncbi:TIGR03016 family PEP-CTERM system-associated outer membrane protein [Permianibacter aggregans]|uniref:Uncharacterized protein (PEP-CTERM system associated) n=1 Tax=Permianibacter aggregans TaxID=1510150 RepID=A0A4R6UQ28_9GAMM|nr:TIGR03016 family PEP-CTERM system-associated outer membrane protein [Permianibacter aggregans]TDQ49121.1 uncharacterized protein (PEP-CTERM system associated) [Permianibacter aggregans]